MERVLSFLLSGPGLMGKQHAALLRARPDCRLAAVVAPSDGPGRDFASRNGATFYASVDDALAGERFDAAIISSPNAFHFEQAESCLEKGVPVLIEKPVTDTIESARRLVELATGRDVPVLVGHHRTYSPLLGRAKAFLDSPKLGRLVAVQGAALFLKPADYFEQGAWRTRLGGGPILINLIHEVGLMRYFGGEIDSVFAVARHGIRNFEVEDTVAIALTFANGALGTFLLSDTAASSKSWEMTSGENPVYPHYPSDDCYHFAGTNGSLDFPSMRARHYAEGTAPSWWSPFAEERIAVDPGKPLERQLDHFVDVVRGEAVPRVSARDGYLNMAVIEAITRSIAARTMVDVEHCWSPGGQRA